MKAIPTAPTTDKRNYFAYLQAGYKICRGCQLFVIWAGRNCPFCRHQLRTKPRNSASRRRFFAARTKPLEIKKDTRYCSRCGSTSSGYQKKRASGKIYPQWYKDGKGGHTCTPCWKKPL